ncbi:MAG: hypothetical protein V7754_09895, partial [Halioglobus sp.]
AIYLPDKTGLLIYLTRDRFNEAKQTIGPKKEHPIPPLKLKYYILSGRIRRKLTKILHRTQPTDRKNSALA